MAKVYVIITDGQNVLVGRGGNSGDPPAARQGLHLPGGTIDRGENARVAALREVREETGIVVQPGDIVAEFQTPRTGGVRFIVIRVDSVAELVRDHHRPGVDNPHDEPLEEVLALPAANSWTNPGFSLDYHTDWFGFGLEAANDRHLFQ